jgi:ribosomal protein S12 methylthiotransferase accessory factor
MEMTITMPGAGRVEAHFGGLTVTTDQDGTAPNPFALFLASIGTCAGIYVARFCQGRGVPHDRIRIHERVEADPATGHVGRIVLDIELPADFPEKYREAVIRAADQCKVKKHLDKAPEIEVNTVVGVS